MPEENTRPDVPVSERPDDQSDRLAQPADDEQPPRLPFPVVGIGASAGGLEAVSEFLAAMPPDAGMAFVLIQHLPPDRDSLMVDILNKRTAMQVRQVEDGMEVEADHVYVIRPGHVLTLHEGRLHLGAQLGGPRAANRPVDDFFKSLAEEQRERAIAIIMSGMGSNGSAGAQSLKAVGGMCIAQAPESAKFPSMPRHLIDSGNADFILRPQEMPDVLLAYAGHPYTRGGREMAAAALLRRAHEQLRDILIILRHRTRQEFGGYKKPTLLRRVQRRMGLARVTELEDYVKLLRHSPGEAVALADDLLIHVTGFFRDPQAWDALREQVIVPLVASRGPDDQVRCWVTACSTGDEAYTLAILLVEEAERAGKPLDIKVFATDMAQRTLAQARAGVYPGGIEAEISPERLGRFFEKVDAVYRVRQDLRERVVFAPQNVLQDPPFSRLDIATCRNLLIYLEPDVQQRLLGLLHFGLREGGALFLGTSETAAAADGMFEPIDKKARIFRRVGRTRHGAIDFPLPRSLRARRGDGPEEAPRRHAVPARLTHAQLTQRALLEHHLPAAVLVDRDHHILYYQGDTTPFLEQRTGEPTRELEALAKEGVKAAVRIALRRAAATKARSTALDGWVEAEDGRRTRVAVTASPAAGDGPAEHFVVSFDLREDAPAAPAEPGGANGEPRSPSDGDEAAELRRVRDELQSTVEELQSTNEEMKSAAEEASSINEELQSSNEELETSKEEMQSLNEELNTVNAQLQAKIEEHQATSSDLGSLLASTDIAVLFLDTRLRIRRFTAPVRELFEVLASDVGRPLTDFAQKFADPDFAADARTVLERLVPVEREVVAGNGRWFIRRITPYRTADDRINGVVVAFVDVTARVWTAARLAETARLLDLSNDAIIVRDVNNRITYWNRGAAEVFGYSAAEAVGQDLHRLLRTEFELPLDQLVSILREKDRMTGEVVQVSRDGRRHTLLCRWALDRDAAGAPASILTTTTDISDRTRAEQALRETEERFRLLVEGARGFAMLMLDPGGRIVTWNVGAERMLGYTESEAIGLHGSIIFTPEDRAAGEPEKETAEAIRAGQAADERWHLRRDGSRFWGSGMLHALRGDAPGGENVRGFVKVLRDDTARKMTEEALQQAKAAAESANQIKDEFLATLSHELRTPLSSILLWANMLRGDTKDPQRLEEGLAAIKSSAESQRELIDDLLDTSRITSGKVRLQPQPVDLQALVHEAIETILPTAGARKVTVSADLDPRAGVVTADPDRLRQVIWNLVSNAVKFTPEGGRVDVAMRRRGRTVEVRVTDTGQGIDPEFLPHVFTPFRQGDGSTTRRHGGLGLGLAISRQLVELHGGTIHAESPGAGKGATFTIQLPLPTTAVLKPAPAGAKAAPSPAAGGGVSGVRVLLVEDDPETRRALELLLGGAGAVVTAVGSAAAALKTLGRERPDVLVSDIGLPETNGYALLRQIREREAAAKAPPLPALALTAFAREQDRRRALDAGFQHYLSKPVEPEELLAALHRLAGAANDAT